jgi:hypothetical protein
LFGLNSQLGLELLVGSANQSPYFSTRSLTCLRATRWLIPRFSGDDRCLLVGFIPWFEKRSRRRVRRKIQIPDSLSIEGTRYAPGVFNLKAAGRRCSSDQFRKRTIVRYPITRPGMLTSADLLHDTTDRMLPYSWAICYAPLSCAACMQILCWSTDTILSGI